MEAGKSDICKADWQAGNSGRSLCCSLDSRGRLEAEFVKWLHLSQNIIEIAQSVIDVSLYIQLLTAEVALNDSCLIEYSWLR